MNLRLYNARILTMEPGRDIFQGEIWVKNEKIVYVADQEEIEREWRGEGVPGVSGVCAIAGEGNFLMPGFKDCH